LLHNIFLSSWSFQLRIFIRWRIIRTWSLLNIKVSISRGNILWSTVVIFSLILMTISTVVVWSLIVWLSWHLKMIHLLLDILRARFLWLIFLISLILRIRAWNLIRVLLVFALAWLAYWRCLSSILVCLSLLLLLSLLILLLSFRETLENVQNILILAILICSLSLLLILSMLIELLLVVILLKLRW
jgi:hypothetical protein